MCVHPQPSDDDGGSSDHRNAVLVLEVSLGTVVFPKGLGQHPK
jgi:hypothetical protein